ncbi:MAG: 16S rRNA (adenine(1518)-N(6)/adenine(1519)-N(6))-dimethyltransferase RsmA [Candidatus Pacebacteria bacterium]|nr:16S rRNA (adenine(1518)-N(6)/adenine(1519)-N(6))-dimethyltransferase RsmA [Candidatus Paceibacterota bacterium]MDD5356813.1 16S rRNA (adenine(1518)-N(6)/adenine(1519)-N(6))-dimethyltransferase RsmA [Candidatus Paceibacterota bacterium]
MEAKKSLGQNFLNSKPALEKIVTAAKLSHEDIVLEVGPGKGTLTELLLEKAGKVIAVEKDDRLIPFLEEKFQREIASGNFTLVHGDILNFEPSSYKLQVNSYKLVANIPYYITGIFIRKFLSEVTQPSTMILMLQKEVAERIVARDGKESILSMSVKAYGTPKIIGIVKAGSFTPSPAVDSAILAIENISKDFFRGISEETFFDLLKAGFGSKRKQLQNNLRTNKNISQELMQNIFKKVEIGERARAEDLTLLQWKKLVEVMEESDPKLFESLKA